MGARQERVWGQKTEEKANSETIKMKTRTEATVKCVTGTSHERRNVFGLWEEIYYARYNYVQ